MCKGRHRACVGLRCKSIRFLQISSWERHLLVCLPWCCRKIDEKARRSALFRQSHTIRVIGTSRPCHVFWCFQPRRTMATVETSEKWDDDWKGARGFGLPENSLHVCILVVCLTIRLGKYFEANSFYYLCFTNG